MGWSGSLGASSRVGNSVTYTPDTVASGAYTVAAFTAPKKAVYQFVLQGSGGGMRVIDEEGASCSAGGKGGLTIGYLLLEAGQTVYVGAGGVCSAAFVSRVYADTLAATGSKDNLYFVAGAGGEGGANWGQRWNMKSGAGGEGGGNSGTSGVNAIGTGGSGATQTSGYQYGVGHPGGGYWNENNTSHHGGRGGDGLWGGLGGSGSSGGGGGSGYVYSTVLTVGSNTYTSSTQQSGGAGSNSAGAVSVTYYADAELPVTFNGVKLMEMFFNGSRVEHLIYNGAAVFAHTLKRYGAFLRGCLLPVGTLVKPKKVLI